MAKSGTVNFYNGVATQSLRFNKADSARLTRTPAGASNLKIFTISCWIKLCTPSLSGMDFGLLGVGDANQIGISGAGAFGSGYDNELIIRIGGSTLGSWPMRFRDVSAWYHIVVAIKVDHSTATSRQKLYVNGVDQGNMSANMSDADTAFNTAAEHCIGSFATAQYTNAYLAEYNFIDGQQLTPSSFGETKNGAWIPIDTSGLTFGTNGFRLDFADSAVDAPTSEGTEDTDNIGSDSSGEHNNWTSVNIVASDCALPDSPENNFATLNPLMNYGESSRVVSEGNLKFSDGVNNSYYARIGANLPFEGKWYWEVLISGNISSYFFANGTCNIEDNNNIVSQSTNSSELTGPHIIAENGKYYDGSLTAEYTGFSTGDILQVYFDADIGSLFMGRNNTAFNSGSAVATSLPAQEIHCAMANTGSVDGSFSLYNFGQDSSFAGNKTAQGNTDGNGIGDFYYAPPSGFLAICTSNLPEPTIGPNSDTQSDDHFNTVLYTGNANARSITGVGFQPDWVWIKTRSAGLYHFLTDSSRGVTHTLSSNTNDNEDFSSEDVLSAFGSDGFTLTADDGSGYYGWNRNNDTLVAWNWKANGGTATATISESGDNPAASVQANPTAGFSIVTYTGTGDTGTIAHGLGAVPTWILIKNRDVADAWAVYHGSNTSAPATDYLVLNTTAATVDAVGWWDDTAPTSSVFTVHDQHSVNADGEKYVAYVFADVKGYSKFGVYTGTGNANGPFVFTGFRPAFIIRKKTNAVGDWIIMDTSRDPANLSDDRILANSNVAEANNGNNIDILSNGFKERNADGYSNANGSTYLYMAFAESPFKYANAK